MWPECEKCGRPGAEKGIQLSLRQPVLLSDLVAPSKRCRWSATAAGEQLEPEGSSGSAPPFAEYSSSVNRRIVAIITSHLRGKLTTKGSDTVGLAQQSYFGTATLTRDADRVGRAPTCQTAVKEQQNHECLGGMRRSDSGVQDRWHPDPGVIEMFVDEFPRLAVSSTIYAAADRRAGFGGDVPAHLHRQ